MSEEKLTEEQIMDLAEIAANIKCTKCGKHLYNKELGRPEIPFRMGVVEDNMEYEMVKEQFGTTEILLCFECLFKTMLK